MTGTRMGWPVPWSQRPTFPSPPTSYSEVVSIRPSSIRLALAVVPPMSKEMRFARPSCWPMRCAAITPAAGPDSTAPAGILSASGTSKTPPFEPMT